MSRRIDFSPSKMECYFDMRCHYDKENYPEMECCSKFYFLIKLYFEMELSQEREWYTEKEYFPRVKCCRKNVSIGYFSFRIYDGFGKQQKLEVS